ncbi:MAG: DMT family transporter [Rhodospirillales bacterium]
MPDQPLPLPSKAPYLRGLTLSALGIFIISPDGLLVRLIHEAGVWEIIFFRSLFMGLTLGLMLVVRYRSRFFGVWRSIGGLGLFSALIMVGSNFGFVGALTHTTVANTLVIIATMPFFSAVLGWVLIGEKVRTGTWVSILFAMCGIAVIFSGSLGGGSWMGDLMATAAALFMGLNLVILRKAKQHDMTPALCLSGFLGAGLAFLWAEPYSVTAHDLSVLAFIGVVILPLSLALFLSGTRTVPAAEVALLALIETVLGPLWVWLGVGERPTSLALAGGFIVIMAITANAIIGSRRQSGRTKS